MTIQKGLPEVCPVCDRDDMQFWTVRETAEKLRVSKANIYRLIRDGVLWHVHLSQRRLRVSVGKLREQLNDPGNFVNQECPECRGDNVPAQIMDALRRKHGVGD